MVKAMVKAMAKAMAKVLKWYLPEHNNIKMVQNQELVVENECYFL